MRIRTGVGELSVRDSSAGGEGPVAVLWHSLFVDDRSWDRIAPGLICTHRLIRIDGPGHGSSAPTRDAFTLDDCARAAITVLDRLGVADPVDWVGCAWGGHVGIVLAATVPERIRSLVAFNAPVRALSPAEARRVRIAPVLLRLVGAVPPVVSGVTEALLSPATRERDPDAVAYVRECLRGADRFALANAIRSISLCRPDLSAHLSKITAPTLLVTSDADPMWTVAEAEAAAARMPRASARVVEATEHLTPYEAPATSLGLIEDVWAGVSR